MKRKIEFSRESRSSSDLIMYSESKSYQPLGTISKIKLYSILSKSQKIKINKLYCDKCTENGCLADICKASEDEVVLLIAEDRI